MRAVLLLLTWRRIHLVLYRRGEGWQADGPRMTQKPAAASFTPLLLERVHWSLRRPPLRHGNVSCVMQLL